jgi:hypothetical protein
MYYLDQFSAIETGWAGRIRTFDTGSKGRGLTAWRPPIPELPRKKFIRSREISIQLFSSALGLPPSARTF